jgi:hypothetical protein
LIKAGLPAGFKAYALGQEGKAYVAYLGGLPDKDKPQPDNEQSASLQLALPDGDYIVSWLNVLTGEKSKPQKVKSSAGLVELHAPVFRDDIAFSIRK